MRTGEVINGYDIITEPTNSGGGMCVWAFAAKGGREYFIKEFLQPKWPTPESMGSPAGKERRRADCRQFERRHNEIMRRLVRATTTPGGGNLVTAVDFFRSGTTYYKVTEKIVTSSLASLRELPVRERAVILRTLVLSLQMLHKKEIVHGDLKPANVLIQQVPESSLHTAKLIDFDDSYLSGNPPPRDQVVGDSVFGAPEWFSYAKKESAVLPGALTSAADIFALGLLFHHYLTDSLPGYESDRFSAPGQAVGAGCRLRVDGRLSTGLAGLLSRMLAPASVGRPTVDQVFTELRNEALLTLETPSPRRVILNMSGSSPMSAVTPGGPGTSDHDGREHRDAVDGTHSRVRINLGNKPKER
jgi:eukaryotic-like serine/threonine-protein kinase